MSDSKLTKNTNFSQNQNTGSSQNLKGRVVDAGTKQRAGDAMSDDRYCTRQVQGSGGCRRCRFDRRWSVVDVTRPREML